METWEPTTIFRMVIDHTNLFFHNCMHIFELESQGNYFQKDNGVAIPKATMTTKSLAINHPEMMDGIANTL